MGAVVGYGLPLQGRCLEGFDFLGLHQFYLSKALSGCVHRLGRCGPGSNPGRETNLYLVRLMAGPRLYTAQMAVRFCHEVPICVVSV